MTTKEQHKKWREKNPDKVHFWSRKYRENNPEKIKILQKQWKTENVDKVREYNKFYKQNNKKKVKKWGNKYRQRHKEKIREYKKKYREKYKMKKAGRPKLKQCEVCGAMEMICFDHDHKTGKFRGWICRRCNLILGFAKDNSQLLISLSEYLKKYEKGGLDRGFNY